MSTGSTSSTQTVKTPPASANLLLLRKQDFYPMAIGIIGIGDRQARKKF